MSVTRRQEILQELRSRVGAITVDNGFQTDAGLAVAFGEVSQLGPDDPDAAIALVVGDDAPSDQGDETLVQLPVDVQILVKADLTAPWATVEAGIADIKQAVESGDRTLGNRLTRDLARGRTRTLRRQPGSGDVGASVTYTATYLETWGEVQGET